MSAPWEIVFDDLDRSPILEEAIRERAAKLEKFADGITSCRVPVGNYRNAPLTASRR